MAEGEIDMNHPYIYRSQRTAWSFLIEKDECQTSEEFPEQLRDLHLDDKISEILAEEISRGNSEIVIFDIGSGRDGIIIKSFLKSDEFPKLHKLLAEHSGINVRIVGVTGASNGQTQGQLLEKAEQEFDGEQAQKSNITVENYGYTITKANTLKSFMEMVKV
jgi:hypothetical protein